MDFKKQYTAWLNENIIEKRISDNTYRITLPYLNRNNDCIEFYIVNTGDGFYRITDDGETLSELELSGLNIFSSNRRTDIFNKILNSHAVTLSDSNELFITCSADDIPLRKHMLSQCVLKISDMFYLTRPSVQSLFIEDVQMFLEDNDIRFTPDVSFIGKSKLVTNYDFCIPKSKEAIERIIKVVNNIERTQSESIMFLWEDTKDARKSPANLCVFIHDKVSPPALTAMKNYSIIPILWSNKDNYIEMLKK